MMGRTNACRVIQTLVVSVMFVGEAGRVVTAAAFSDPLAAPPVAQAAVATQISTADRTADRQPPFTQPDVRKHLAARDLREPSRWIDPVPPLPGRRWPFRADPRRWPRLFANTTECTLSFNPVTRRHWWQR